MTRNLKLIGLALFAVLALGAQSASAVVEHSFTSGSVSSTTVLTGTTEPGTQEGFKLTNAIVKCVDVTHRGTVVGGATDHISVVPIFVDATCTATGGIAATIDNNGCTFTFDSDTFENTTHFAAGETHANISLACGHSGSIAITAGGCTIHIGTTHQTPEPNMIVNHNLPGARYELIPNHSGGKTAFTVTTTVRTIKALSTGANCLLLGLGANGTHSNGIYTGKSYITCYEDSKAFNPHTETASEGALVNCGMSTP